MDVTSLNLSVNLFIGMGGGHNTSAGVNGKGNIEDTFEECICLLKKKLLI
ncbi:hypothetical protein KAI60_00180 [Candidatus Bathyarchaeota archaeon]|nr:hypothetical protein [Candidatus Bathyarchaeota archaeon]